MQIKHLFAVLSGPIKLGPRNGVLIKGNAPRQSTGNPLFARKIFFLMGRVPALQGGTHAVAFDSLYQNHGRSILTLAGTAIRRVEFFRILATPFYLRHFDVGERVHQLF